jgi:hypothetical protein
MNLELIHQKIYEIRGVKIMLDFDLATIYEVETRVLKQSVKRNIDRFPPDFMFELNEDEIQFMVSQIVIPSKSYFGGSKPFAFTEQGVSMLSAVLKSKKAIHVSISIMRAFITIKQYANNYQELFKKINEIELKNNKQFDDVFEAINYLLKKDTLEKQTIGRKKIGYKEENE